MHEGMPGNKWRDLQGTVRLYAHASPGNLLINLWIEEQRKYIREMTDLMALLV